MRHITANTGHTIPLGRRGENQATEVSFDVSAWLKDYPAGEIRLIAQRQGDAYPYPVVTTRHNNTIRWLVSAADSGVQGFGACELQLWAGEMLMKSRPFSTYTSAALEDPDKVPDVLEPYYQRLDELIAEAEAAVAAGVVPEEVWLKGYAEGRSVTITDGAENRPLKQLRVSMTPRQTAPSPDQPIPIPGYTSATLSITETSDDDTRETELSLDFIPRGDTASVTCRYGYVDLIPGTLHAFGEIFRPTEADSVEDCSAFYKLARFTIPETYAVQHLRCNKAITLLRAPNPGELLTENQAYCRIDEANPEELLLYYHQAIPLTNLLSGIEFFLPTAAEKVVSIAPHDVRTHGGYHMTIALPESDASDTRTLSVIWRRDATTYLDGLALDEVWDVINSNKTEGREMLCRIVAAGEEHLSASRNITEGELIVVNGRLAVATANIAAGAGIIFGVNVQETSLAAEIAAPKKQVLSDELKAALLTIAEKASYSDTHGQDYYDALYAALYPPAELLSITASFAQGSHVVYDSDTLESLKPYLTVTGAYDDGTSKTLTNYTLSGTLAEGTSTITVTAGGKTATFTVSVTHKVAQVTGISAVFSQGSVVIYDNASLDDLKPYLVVTASYDDGTSAAVSSYTLSGTLAAGTSTITVSYGGFSDTFTVTVTQHPAELTSITAVFTQGDNVIYATDSLDTLKQYLVVTAHYDDNTDTVVSDYTLSGTLTEGTSTITVSFGGKTTTFGVTVTEYDTQPVIMTEGVCWSATANQTITKDGFGITTWYPFSFTQEALEACQYWDAENGYMTVNGWAGIKYYTADPKTLAAGYTWPVSNGAKHQVGLNGAGRGYSSITKNSAVNYQFSRYSVSAVENNCISFTVPLLDVDDCYAYWTKPQAKSILPTGVEDGDIIFAGKNTPYYKLHNISEASGT